MYAKNIASIALCLMVTAASMGAERPNIVVILVDDMGFSDLGCFGSEIPTPNLDALASNGVRLSQFYNTGRCCPTRASLLTGLYPHQAGVGHMTDDKKLPGYQGRLNDQCVTIAEALKPAGYFTAMVGKWHVGQNFGVTPWDRGFDRSLNAAAGGFYFSGSAKAKLFYNGQEIENHDPRLPKDWYSTDLWTTTGLEFIDESRAAKQPFFLYLAHNAPHFPLQAPAEAIAKFRGQYKVGWDKLREHRLAKQLQLGLIDKNWKPASRPDTIQAWPSVSTEEQDRFDHLMATYAACVYRMDVAVGNLVEGLKQRGLFDNTLIMFMSDNGGNAESGPPGRTNGDPSQFNSDWFCGESWAYLQNTPFRKYKHYNHEGGIASAFIAHWPQGISSKGEIRTEPAHLVDIMATCVDASGAQYPVTHKDQPIIPMEGRSLLPVFASKPIQREALYWEHEGNAAIRIGDSKLVRLGYKGAWELYDLKADRTEQNNLAQSQSEKAHSMAAAWDAWAERAHVKPYPFEQNDVTGKKKKKKNPDAKSNKGKGKKAATT